MMMNIMLIILFFILGFMFSKKLDMLKKHMDNKRMLEDHVRKFVNLHNNLENSKLVFRSRVNQTVILETNLVDIGLVSIVYLMDKEIVCIYKENKCCYTSENINKEYNEKIMNKIHEKYGNEINDVVDVLGVIISKSELEKNLKEFEKKYPNMDLSLLNNKSEMSDIEKIIEDNDKKLDIDTILDKINKVGIENLTKEELHFLKNESKK